MAAGRWRRLIVLDMRLSRFRSQDGNGIEDRIGRLGRRDGRPWKRIERRTVVTGGLRIITLRTIVRECMREGRRRDVL